MQLIVKDYIRVRVCIYVYVYLRASVNMYV